MSKWAVWPLAILAAMLILAIAAAVPGQEQDKRPLQPLLQDYYSGTVTILDIPAPAGTQIVACVEDCSTYQTGMTAVGEAGAYTGLVIEPTDRRMIGRDVTFHIVNEHGSIQASETREFYGVYDLYTLDLTFVEPLPRAPTPTPSPRPHQSLPRRPNLRPPRNRLPSRRRPFQRQHPRPSCR